MENSPVLLAKRANRWFMEAMSPLFLKVTGASKLSFLSIRADSMPKHLLSPLALYSDSAPFSQGVDV